MRNRWKNKQKKKQSPVEEIKKPVEIDIKPIETPIIIEPKKELFLEKIRNNDVLLVFTIIISLIVITLSYTTFISIIDMREPVIIKLETVDNYTNLVRDECGYMYTPVNPPLTDAVTYSEKLKSTFVPIVLNESDTYSAELVSSKLTRGSTFTFKQITNFKLVDPSQYIKKC